MTKTKIQLSKSSIKNDLICRTNLWCIFNSIMTRYIVRNARANEEKYISVRRDDARWVVLNIPPVLSNTYTQLAVCVSVVY